MKINLDEDNSLEVKSDLNNKLNLIFKSKQDTKTTILAAKLDAQQMDKLIAQLISLKAKVK